MTYLIGVDGGGTSTVARIADEAGRTLGEGRAGPSNVKSVGVDAGLDALGAAVDAAWAKAGLSTAPAALACLGLAGFDRPDDKAILEQWNTSRRVANHLILVNDGDLVLAAGTGDNVGVAVIGGTGSIAVGRAADGRTARAGGWGHVFGDEGSAYGVAVAGLRLAARRVDGRQALSVLKPKDRAADTSGGPLVEHLCRALSVDRGEDFITAIYGRGMDRAAIAGLAPAVLAASVDDPEVVSWVLEPAGYDLGQAALAVARSLGWDTPVLPLAMAGSFLLSARPVADAMLGYLATVGKLQALDTRVPEPVAGAVALARRHLNERA